MPTGTSPAAIAPTTVPSANGVSTEAIPKTVSTVRCSRARMVPARSAYEVPRKTIPIAAMNSGIDSVETIEPNATG